MGVNPQSVAVVVCAYTMERWDHLVASLLSAAHQSAPVREIVLVVDHNEALLERARAELAPAIDGLRVLPNSRKQGLSGARNTALAEVEADIVVFLDDDAAAEAEWLDALLRHYDDASVIAVGGAARPVWPEGAQRPVTLPAEGGGRGELDWVVGCTYSGQPQVARPVRNLMGCNMSFRREVFLRIGGFSEDLGRVGRTPLGCEETELCIRAHNAHPGTRIVFEPDAVVRHQVSSDRLSWRYLRHRCYAEGLSKAAVSAMVGANQALETERAYVAKVLPGGFWRELTGGLRHQKQGLDGVLGAAAIMLALASTAAGYARARAAGVRLAG